MSVAPERVKQAGEKRTISFDFTSKLKSGDTVASVTAVTAEAGITASAPSLVGNVVSVQISGGTNITRYNLDCEVLATPSGDILKLDAIIRISDTDN